MKYVQTFVIVGLKATGHRKIVNMNRHSLPTGFHNHVCRMSLVTAIKLKDK